MCRGRTNRLKYFTSLPTLKIYISILLKFTWFIKEQNSHTLPQRVSYNCSHNRDKYYTAGTATDLEKKNLLAFYLG